MKNVFKRLLRWGYYRPGWLLNIFQLLVKGVTFGSGLELTGVLFIKNRGKVILGKQVRINSSARSNPIGVGMKTYMQILEGGLLIIGDRTGVSNTAFTSASEIRIGSDVRIGSGCKIYDTDFHPLNPFDRTQRNGNAAPAKSRPVVIEDFAFIGAGSFVLKGTHIGRYSIIGAGSVVSGNIPSGEIWAGNPARKIRELTEEEMNEHGLALNVSGQG